MKQFFFFALFTYFTLPVFAQESLREVDLRINGIGSGTSYSTVVKKLGKSFRSETEKFDADSACSGSAETHLTLYYPGLEIVFLGDGKGRALEVYSIESTSKKWTISGTSIGADMKDVSAKFGEPISKEEKSDETVLYYVTKENLGTVRFYFRDNKLIKAAMTETLC